MMTMLIEAAVISHLSNILGTDNVFAERPIDPPDEYYVVERTSSGEINHIQSAMIAVQSISGTSLLRAAEMSEAVRKAMPLIVQYYDDVCSCKMNSMYNFTDTSTKQYRYQAVYDVYFMMEGD